MRATIDWTLSKSSFSLGGYLKFEDIFANLYVVKCNRESEKASGRRFGEKRDDAWKWLTGGAIIVGVTALLFFPLLLLSIPGTTLPDPVGAVDVKLMLSGFEPVYTQSIAGPYIKNLTADEYAPLRGTGLFASYYTSENVQQISLEEVCVAGRIFYILHPYAHEFSIP